MFSECKNDSLVTKETIEIFKHLANSYLISHVVKNDLEKDFTQYLMDILKIKEKVIKDIGAIFEQEQYIYFPTTLTSEDIIYCFSYGKDKYINGILNETDFNIQIKCNNYSKEECFQNIINEFLNKDINQDDIKIIKDNLSKIKIFFEKLENVKFTFNCDWLLTPINNLKGESLEYPNKLLIKNKYKNILNFDNNKIFDGIKIYAKALYASFEGNKDIPIKYENKEINEIITNIRLNKKFNYEYGYRLMNFYNFNLFEDNESKTMMLIIETIDDIILNQNLKKFYSKYFSFIISDIYEEFIISVVSSKSPNLEKAK